MARLELKLRAEQPTNRTPPFRKPVELQEHSSQEFSYVQQSEMSGEGICPYHENQNNTATFAGKFRVLAIVAIAQFPNFALLAVFGVSCARVSTQLACAET